MNYHIYVRGVLAGTTLTAVKALAIVTKRFHGIQDVVVKKGDTIVWKA